MNRRQQFSFSFPELQYSPLEFNSRKICHYLPNWTRWNKRGKVWSSANSLFKWRFYSRRRRCCLSSLSNSWERQLPLYIALSPHFSRFTFPISLIAPAAQGKMYCAGNVDSPSAASLTSHAFVLRGSSRVPAPRGAGMRDEPLRTFAWEATASPGCFVMYWPVFFLAPFFFSSRWKLLLVWTTRQS